MIVYDITNSEDNPIYKALEQSNLSRQYDFLRSIVEASIGMNCLFLSTYIIKALHFHAITCLHPCAGEYRPCPVLVGDFRPPEHYLVGSMMDDFVNQVNIIWERADPVELAAFVLWKLNFIHPFINGNGRTARAISYFVLCVKVGGWLPGRIILPELLRGERDAYVAALKSVDTSFKAGAFDISPLKTIVSELLAKQLST
ncbi:MAG: Fic family protein [Methylococcales bacterium]